MPRLIALGSSSVEPGSPLPRYLAERLQLDPVAVGVRGSRVSQWRGWLPSQPIEAVRALRATEPGDVVVIHLGGNEPVSRPATPEDIASTHVAVRGLMNPEAQGPVWLPPPRFEATATDGGGRPMRGRRAAMVTALSASGVPFVSREVTGLSFRSDGVHPTRTGYRQWAEQVVPELRLAIASRQGAWDLCPAIWGLGLVGLFVLS